MELLDIFNQYARSELMVLVPVLFFLNKMIGQSKISNQWIPAICTGVSILLCGFHIFGYSPVVTFGQVMMALFATVTQGILYAGATMFFNLVVSSAGNKNSTQNTDKNQ